MLSNFPSLSFSPEYHDIYIKKYDNIIYNAYNGLLIGDESDDHALHTNRVMRSKRGFELLDFTNDTSNMQHISGENILLSNL